MIELPDGRLVTSDEAVDLLTKMGAATLRIITADAVRTPPYMAMSGPVVFIGSPNGMIAIDDVAGAVPLYTHCLDERLPYRERGPDRIHLPALSR